MKLSRRRVYDITELKWLHLTFSKSQVLWEGEKLTSCWSSSASHHDKNYRYRVFTGPDGKEYEWELKLGSNPCNVISDHYWSSDSVVWFITFCSSFFFSNTLAVSQGCSKAPNRILQPSKLWHHRRRTPIFFRNFSRRRTYGWPYICHIHLRRKKSEAEAKGCGCQLVVVNIYSPTLKFCYAKSTWRLENLSNHIPTWMFPPLNYYFVSSDIPHFHLIVFISFTI